MKSGLVIRAWQPGDLMLLAEAAPRLSEHTVRMRFWGPFRTLPASYLRRVQERWPQSWDAVVALVGEELVGWAEFGRDRAHPEFADVGACVVDAEQGHGVGTALMAALLERARESGVTSLHADIHPYNAPARHAWHSVTGAWSSDYPLAG
jgi:RimJ/RimL family protein N-acetyltransferase